MYKNLKIAITDAAHLKAVCDVLGSMGYVEPNSDGDIIYTSDIGNTFNTFDALSDMHYIYEEATLTDLLKMRDEMVKRNANKDKTSS